MIWSSLGVTKSEKYSHIKVKKKSFKSVDFYFIFCFEYFPLGITYKIVTIRLVHFTNRINLNVPIVFTNHIKNILKKLLFLVKEFL